ncbi:hypothetical protein ATANTOWER_031220, partial [Ataeniobius toweri]|nr:hypothetical protein [Ataeniobius toweri]
LDSSGTYSTIWFTKPGKTNIQGIRHLRFHPPPPLRVAHEVTVSPRAADAWPASNRKKKYPYVFSPGMSQGDNCVMDCQSKTERWVRV